MTISPEKKASPTSESSQSTPAGAIDGFERMRKETHARTGDDERPVFSLGWDLRLRSPYQSWEGATSWLGGVPSAPDGFAWPCGSDGKPLHFFAQIDLGALKGLSAEQRRPSGLVLTGALLVFVGLRDHVVVTFTEAQMREARAVAIPAALPPIREIGHWSDQQTFNQWPVDALPLIDDGSDHQLFLSGPFAEPREWISTWAIAKIEADIVLNEIEIVRRQAATAQKARSSQKAKTPFLRKLLTVLRVIFVKTLFPRSEPASTPSPKPRPRGLRNAKAQDKFDAMLRVVSDESFAKIHKALVRWRNHAAKADPAAPADTAILKDLMTLRNLMAYLMPPGYMLPIVLRGYPAGVWNHICRENGIQGLVEDFAKVPPGQRAFVDAAITGSRGHKLLGLAKLDPWINSEDRRGQDLLIAIASDALLKTEMEHFHAVSVWCDRDGMAEGKYDKGQVIRYGNG